MGTSPDTVAPHPFSILQEPRNVDSRKWETPIRCDDLLAYQELFSKSRGMTKLEIAMHVRFKTSSLLTSAYRGAARPIGMAHCSATTSWDNAKL
jgi:hypothetical protein